MTGERTANGPIVVMDDDEAMRRACEATLCSAGYQVETYQDGPSGLKRVEQGGVALVVVDLKMPGLSGTEVVERVRLVDPDVVVIVITGYATVDAAVETMKVGAYDFIPKPFTAEELRVIIARGMERRRLSMEAKRLREEKEAQARRFITFASHQLQSPLGAVQQYLDVMRHQLGEDLPQQHRSWIERSHKKIADMLELIGRWLTVSMVEGGQLATGRQRVFWQDMVPEVLESLAVAAKDKQVTLHDEVPRTLPAVVGDVPALRILLANLAGNAVKYNRPGGRVTIRAHTDQTTASLSVSDTGVGIPPEDQERVFDEFYRVPGQTEEGTGMGLFICKKIAEELGGRLTLVSRPGGGAEFSVVLPRAQADAAGGE